jgi:hypothetical protein
MGFTVTSATVNGVTFAPLTVPDDGGSGSVTVGNFTINFENERVASNAVGSTSAPFTSLSSSGCQLMRIWRTDGEISEKRAILMGRIGRMGPMGLSARTRGLELDAEAAGDAGDVVVCAAQFAIVIDVGGAAIAALDGETGAEQGAIAANRGAGDSEGLAGAVGESK